MQRALIVIGIMLLLAGLLWPWLGKMPFGRLPGDIVIDRGQFKIYIPLMTTLLVSFAVSLLFWLLRR